MMAIFRVWTSLDELKQRRVSKRAVSAILARSTGVFSDVEQEAQQMQSYEFIA